MLRRLALVADAQGVELEIDNSLVEQLAAAGFRPEFGARELRRLIRSQLETELARAMLANDVKEGNHVLARLDGGERKVVLEPRPKTDEQAKEAKPAGKRERSAPKKAAA